MTLRQLARLDWHSLNAAIKRMPNAELEAVRADRTPGSAADSVRARCAAERERRGDYDVIAAGVGLLARRVVA